MPRISRRRRERVEFKARAIRRQSVAMRKVFIKAYESLFKEVIRNLRLRKPREIKKDDKDRQDGIFDLSEWVKNTTKNASPFLADLYKQNLLDRDSGMRFTLTQNEKDVLADRYIRMQELKLSEITGSEAVKIKTFVASKIGAGLQGNDLYSAIHKRFKVITQTRSNTIVRNLTSEAYSAARSDFWDEVAPEVEKEKEWLPSIGGRYDRKHHNDIPGLNGRIGFDERFTWTTPDGMKVSGLYPNDRSLPLSEVINCA